MLFEQRDHREVVRRLAEQFRAVRERVFVQAMRDVVDIVSITFNLMNRARTILQEPRASENTESAIEAGPSPPTSIPAG